MARFPTPKILKLSHIRALARYSFEVFVVGAIYFALAKLDLALTAIHPGAVPVSPAPGFALAAILLRGLRIWPAIFAAALAPHAPTTIADATSADSILALSMAAAATLEAVIAGYLINVWSDGRRTFRDPGGGRKIHDGQPWVECAVRRNHWHWCHMSHGVRVMVRVYRSLDYLVASRCERSACGCTGHSPLGNRRFESL